MFFVENVIVFIPLTVVLLIVLILYFFWKRSKVVEIDHVSVYKSLNQQLDNDRRSGVDRRSGKDRRRGKDRRIFSD